MKAIHGFVKTIAGERKLRRGLRKELVKVGIEGPVEMAELCRRIGESRGRPIKLVAFPMEVPGPCGAWLSASSGDYIVFQSETTRIHQEHIIAHELGHILSGHRAEPDEEEIWSRFMPDLDPGVIRRLLKRTQYDSVREREAETIATLLLERSLVVRLLDEPGSSRTRRMRHVLGEARGWL
ncbi:hypothetical protein [Amycolatopsis keratiniphila]|uniref:IrrE N-terminal-like domain-containing protein n=2 Tax=Amycolatopsis TaxID=1813 RepID=R4T4C2_9PSEU|nr:hypothetical protein [Amycolatopsis keratiniphila]AGM05513.1 hypothetical protein AORI_2927 [Amycolatopsis keratiniphila]